MKLYRAHASNYDDRALLWSGHVISFAVEGRTAKLRVPSTFSYLLQSIAPQPRYQAPCNHMLYDTRCAVDIPSNQTVTTVTATNLNTVSVATLTFPPADYVGGPMILANGEQRMITGVLVNDVTISYPFASINISDSVTLRKGCDHSFTTCRDKFSNGSNFGGCPLVPPKNPFTASRLGGGSS